MTMNEFLKRSICGLFIIIWIFFTVLYFPQLFVLTMIGIIIEIRLFEWPHFEKHYRPLFFIYPLLPLVLIIYLQLSGYTMLNLLAFASCFIFDSSAYIFGKFFGKHKLVPTISPGKTVEGTLGGFLILIASYLAYFKFYLGITSLSSLLTIKNFLIPITIGLLAFFGDLFESYLKRKSNLKDSGTILPGHGGLLDRFDSILFVIVFVFLFRDYLMRILLI